MTLEASEKSALVSAIYSLDQDNMEHFTKKGQPRTEALTEMLGFQITRADVEEVWGDPGEPDTEDEKAEVSVSPPIKVMLEFEQVMGKSRNAIFHQIYKHWMTSKSEALALDERLRKRGQY